MWALPSLVSMQEKCLKCVNRGSAWYPKEIHVPKIVCNFLIHAAPVSNFGTINFQGNLAVLSFTPTQNLTLSITGKTHPGVDDTIRSTWYRNGNSLPLGSKLESLKRPLLNVSQSLTLENSSILDAGTYEVLLAIDPRTHLISHLGCHNNYYSFVGSAVRADDTVLAQTKLELKYYGMLYVLRYKKNQFPQEIISAFFSWLQSIHHLACSCKV